LRVFPGNITANINPYLKKFRDIIGKYQFTNNYKAMHHEFIYDKNERQTKESS